jgi:hypothetical protein
VESIFGPTRLAARQLAHFCLNRLLLDPRGYESGGAGVRLARFA